MSSTTSSVASRPVLAAVVCVMVAAMSQVVGLSSTIDAGLSSVWFDIRGERESDHKVVLVVADAETTARWGEPPWPEAERTALLDVLDESAAGIVFAEPGRLDPQTRPLDPPPLTAVGVVELPAAYFQPPLARGELPPLPADEVPVNYAGDAARIPTVSAHKVVDEKIPASFFNGRVVVIGVTDPARTTMWPTPVGWANPGHVVAHALSGVIDGVPLAPVPWWARLLLAGLLAVGAMRLGQRGRPVNRWAVPLAIAGLVTVADLALFTHGAVRLGVESSLAALATALVFNLLGHMRGLRLALVSVRQSTATRRRIEESEAVADEGRWNRLAEMMRGATDSAWSALATLEPDGRTLHWRGTAGIDRVMVEGWPASRSAAPFDAAFARGAGVTQSELPGLDERAYVLPLIDRGRTWGLWVAAIGESVDARVLERLRTMGARLAADDARIAASARADEVVETRLAVGSLARQYQLLESVCEQMRIGALIADPFGRVHLINASLRSRLSEMTGEAADRLVRRGAPEVLAALAGWTAARARAQFAAAMGERDDMALGHGLRLQRIEIVDEGRGGATVLLLTRGGEGGDRADGAVKIDQNRVRVDVRPLLLKAGRAAAAESRMRIEYEFADPMPRVESETNALTQTVESLYAEIRRHSEAGSVTTVSVSHEEEHVSVLMMNSSYAVPREALNALFRSEPLEAAGPTERMHVAAQAALRAGGRLDATSDPVSGVVFRLALPVARQD